MAPDEAAPPIRQLVGRRHIRSLAVAVLSGLSGCGDGSTNGGMTDAAQAGASPDANLSPDAALLDDHSWAGINFPPTQGTTNAGAFLPGVYAWDYSERQIEAANVTFEAMRLPINVETAHDPVALARMKAYVDRFAGGAAIICMFDTRKDSEGSHGDGVLDDVAAAGAAWAKVHEVFAEYPNVRYELFNEPFGYPIGDATSYVLAMTAVIEAAGLPPERCILDGLGYADDIQAVAAAGWTGDLAFHFYPTWSNTHTQPAYSVLVQDLIGDLGPRTWVTEFGADLTIDNACYETFDDGTQPSSADVNALRGLDDALRFLRASGRGVKGAFAWHGWNNRDTYDFWAAVAQDRGACKIRLIQVND